MGSETVNSTALYKVYLSLMHDDCSSCQFRQSYIDNITQKVFFLEQFYNEHYKPSVKNPCYLHNYPEKMNPEGQPVRRSI